MENAMKKFIVSACLILGLATVSGCSSIQSTGTNLDTARHHAPINTIANSLDDDFEQEEEIVLV